jgi:hypothetical protein
MLARLRHGADPFWDLDGAGVKRDRIRHRIVSMIAFTLAVIASGLTAALWLRTVAPVIPQLGIG